MTKKEKILTITAVIMLVSYLYINLFFIPIIEKVSNIKYNINDYDNKAAFSDTSQNEKAHKSYNKLKEDYNDISRRMYTYDDSSYFINEINNILNCCNAKIDNCDLIKSDKDENKNLLYKEFKVQFNGEYKDICRSIKDIENSKSLMQIENLNMAIDENFMVNADMVIRYYYIDKQNKVVL